jgi:hypothetical protein
LIFWPNKDWLSNAGSVSILTPNLLATLRGRELAARLQRTLQLKDRLEASSSDPTVST